MYMRENIGAICDVDARQVAQVKKQLAKHPTGANAKVYEDYRRSMAKHRGEVLCSRLIRCGGG